MQNNEVTVAPSLVKFAGQMGFKYQEVLAKAKKGDIESIKQLMEFHGTADGTDGLNHAQTCLELIPSATDIKVALACQNLKPKLKELLLERFALAQGRTKNTDLQKPMKEWAPSTWASINNQPIECESCEASKKMAKEMVKNADGSVSKAGLASPGPQANPGADAPQDGMKPSTDGARPTSGSGRNLPAVETSNQMVAPPGAKKPGGKE
jgi:hypothetical protein